MKYPVGIIVLAVSLLFSCKETKEQDKIVYDVVFRESLAGTYEKWQTSDNSYKYYYTYTDRGRGPEYNEEISLSDENFITAQTVKGNNYSKVAIDESFLVADGTATINNMFGTSKDDFKGGQLYFLLHL